MLLVVGVLLVPLMRFVPMPMRTLVRFMPVPVRAMRMAVAACKTAVRQSYTDCSLGAGPAADSSVVSTHITSAGSGTGSTSGHACLETQTNAWAPVVRMVLST